MTDSHSFLGREEQQEVQVFGSSRVRGGTTCHFGQVTLLLHRKGLIYVWYMMGDELRSVPFSRPLPLHVASVCPHSFPYALPHIHPSYSSSRLKTNE